MLFLDLFAGVGGFRRGLELAGHKCVGFCEWDKYATASYTSMHCITEEQRAYLATLDLKQRQKEILKEKYRNGEFYSNDVRLIGRGNVPRADIWTFGAPCQDFSVAGHRKGLEGDRSSLVREVFRAISELEEADRPEWLIYENVKGMLSSNRGYDFAAILLEMEQLGYDIEWEVFNTKNFGIPQNRERVYTIGHTGKRGGKCKVFPLKTTDGKADISEINQIGQWNNSTRKNPNQYRVYAPKGIAPTLNTAEGGGREPHIPVCVPVLTPERAEKRQNGRRFKDNGEEAFTLTSQDRHGVAVSVPSYDTGCDHEPITVTLETGEQLAAVWYEKYQCYIAIRKLTPRECFRLQGWTDDYFDKAQFVNSDSQLYKQAGNGVTVAVVEEIGKAIAEVEKE